MSSFEGLKEAFEKMQSEKSDKKTPAPAVEEVEVGEHKIAKPIYDAIKRQLTDEILRGQKDVWRKDLEKVFADIEELKSANTYKQALNTLKESVSKAQPTQEFDIEKLTAKIKNEAQKEMAATLAAERKQMAENNFYRELVSTAIAKGLDPKFKDVVESIARKNTKVEVNDDGSLSFRDTKGSLILDGANDPTPDYFVKQLSDNFKEIFNTPKAGTGQQLAQPSQHSQNAAKLSPLEMISASIN